MTSAAMTRGGHLPRPAPTRLKPRPAPANQPPSHHPAGPSHRATVAPSPGPAAARGPAGRPPVPAPVGAPAHTAATGLPAWPIVALLAAYPLWWLLGLGVLIFPLATLPMVYAMLRRDPRTGERHRLTLPPGFGWWLLFLAIVVISCAALGAHPAGTVPGTVSSRMLGVGFRLVGYLSLTVILVYLGNVDRFRLPQRRLVGLLAWLFAVTVAGGLLGVFVGRFEFGSPIEMLLPEDIRTIGFVRSLVHPSAAQVMDLLGGERARPAAPWGYTNTWGNNFCLLVAWFVIWGFAGRRRTRAVAFGCLAIAIVPVVYSLNRGLWIGLAVMAVYIAVRLAGRGRFAALTGVGVVAALLAAALVLTPLGSVVSQRLDDGKSNGVRMFLTERALAGVRESPLIGYGSTRTTQGGRNSIAVGETANCERCGNFTVGGNGQLWQLLFAHGLLGTIGYLGFFLYGLWRFRADTSPVGLAATATIVSSLAAMLWYNALVTPLVFTFCAYAALWRNEQSRRTQP